MRGQKFKEMPLEKTLFRRISPVGSKNYLQHPYFILSLVPARLSMDQALFSGSEVEDPPI
jgi:hypothetical protein